jgi:hypothetical protein
MMTHVLVASYFSQVRISSYVIAYISQVILMLLMPWEVIITLGLFTS